MRRGFALIDALLSSLLLAVCISGLASVWVFCLNTVKRSRELTVAGNVARAELEFAKLHGYPYLPKGAYTLQNNTAIWSGAYDKVGNSGKGRWLQGSSTWYDVAGNATKSTDPNARFRTSIKLQDTDVAPSRDGTSYELGTMARRTITVTVNRLPEDQAFLRMSTEFVRDGL